MNTSNEELRSMLFKVIKERDDMKAYLREVGKLKTSEDVDAVLRENVELREKNKKLMDINKELQTALDTANTKSRDLEWAEAIELGRLQGC